MKILIVTPWYPNELHTQDGNFVRAQAEGLAREHDVEVLCVYEGAGPRVRWEVEGSGVRVVRAAYRGTGGRVARVLRRAKAWSAALARREMTPDLIHAHVLIDGGIIAAKLAGELAVPYLITEHSHRWLEDWPTARRPERWLARRAAARAAAVIAVSPALRRGLQRHGIDRPIGVVPNVIASDLFSPAPPAPGRPFTLVHVSDFSANKRVGDLIRAFALLTEEYPDLRLRIAGNGDPAPLASLSRTLHLRPRQIEITGPHEPGEIAEIMRHADLFVLTSVLETQSLVVVEALLSGLPVISTRCGGPEDIIDRPLRGELTPVLNEEMLVGTLHGWVGAGPAPLAVRQQRAADARAEFGGVLATLNRLYDQILAK